MIIRVTDHAIIRARGRFKVGGSRCEVVAMVLGMLFKAKHIHTEPSGRKHYKKGCWVLVVGFEQGCVTVVTVLKRQRLIFLGVDDE